MSFALVAHTGSGGTPSGVTSSAIDTTGADLIVVATGYYNFGVGLTISDSNSNTWTPATVITSSPVNLQLWYCVNPTVGAGHTFTLSGSSVYTGITVAAFSGPAAPSPLDQQGGAAAASPGPITPTAANELVISYAGTAGGAADGVDSGFTITDDIALVSMMSFGISAAYLIQTSATAENPTWTDSSGGVGASGIASFLAASPSTPSHLLSLLASGG
jgi:hypothetical protein